MTTPYRLTLDSWARLRSRRLLAHSIWHDDLRRTAFVYVPRHLKQAGPLPLMLVFHGGGSDPQTIARTSALHLIAEREGFIVAYPAGIRGANGLTWMPSLTDTPAHNADVRFVRHLIADLEARYEIDTAHIYAVGFSIGGTLVYELGCRLANRLAGLAVVSGTMLLTETSPTRPVPLIHIHGTKDRRVPFKGGRGPSTAELNIWPPVQAGIERWRSFNGCDAKPKTIRQGLQSVTGHRYVGPADVELWLVEGGYHAWPGGRRNTEKEDAALLSKVKFSASEVIWTFFKAQGRKQQVAKMSGALAMTAPPAERPLTRPDRV